MNLDEFFKQFVDGYLLGDLKSMSEVTVPSGQIYGGVGYPMVATTLAGMELLGELLMPNTDQFNPSIVNEYFLNYWDNYFSKQNPAYTGLGRLFRQLMRNGISHTFLAKPGVMVEKGSNKQMSIDTTTKEIYIDCNVFFKEFEESYLQLVRPIVNQTTTSALTTKERMQLRLNNLAEIYSEDSDGVFESLPALNSATITTGNRDQVEVSPFFRELGVRSSGASGSMVPITEIDASPTLPFTSVAVSGTISRRRP